MVDGRVHDRRTHRQRDGNLWYRSLRQVPRLYFSFNLPTVHDLYKKQLLCSRLRVEDDCCHRSAYSCHVYHPESQSSFQQRVHMVHTLSHATSAAAACSRRRMSPGATQQRKEKKKVLSSMDPKNRAKLPPDKLYSYRSVSFKGTSQPCMFCPIHIPRASPFGAENPFAQSLAIPRPQPGKTKSPGRT